MKNTPQNNKPSNNKPKSSSKANSGFLGGMLGGNVSRLLLRTRNQTLTEYVDGLHGWVKKPKNNKQ